MSKRLSTVALRPASLALAAVLTLAAADPSAAQDGGTAGFVPAPARGQTFELSIRSIMRGPELVGESPVGVQWSDDGEWVYFRWRAGGGEWDDDRELYRVRADGSGLEQVPDAQADSVGLITGGGDLSEDGRWKLTTTGGDIYLVDRESLEVRRLTDTRDGESQASFVPGDDAILYRSGMNLFRLDLDDGTVRQVTDIRSGNAPREDESAEGQRGFLEEQQLELFEHIRRQKAREEEQEARREAVAGEEPEPLYIPNGERLQGIDPSPDGSFALVSAARQASEARQTSIPFWITESGYTEPRDVRTKVGDESGSSRLGLVDTATGEATWIEADPDATPGNGDEAAQAGAQAGSDDDAREWSVTPRGWNDAGTHALLYHRSDDDTEWVLAVLDATDGETRILARHRDEAWVGGPCGFGCVGWLPDRNTVYYVSEESGYAHAYLVNADGTGGRALTSGEWELLSLELAPDEDRFFITTNEGSPFNQHIGWMEFDGERTYLSSGPGRYEGTLSPDGERIAVLHDVANRPPELYLAEVDDLEDAAGDAEGEAPEAQRQTMVDAMTRVTDSPTEEWASFPWIQPEVVRFGARDGVQVPARIYRPEDMGAQPNGAAVVFVHGAGYLHNVHNYWSSYYREYMFHHLLAAQGYTVLDIDYRGSAGYGSEWRTAIYRFMGGKDLTDQEDGARWLVQNEGIDADRIGLYGGSYGGFITLMALTTGDQVFKSGAALRSVTDWAHYNDGYTSNILNDPQEDREAYVRSSPIYHVENFRPDQHMLILHGMVDTNVHFSDVVRYAQRLIELGKENWEFAVYPVENHGFVEPPSWTDEYRRIFELFERTISAPGCTDDGALCPVPGR
ncbi:MAG TPA: prolyl oligopeptidase family serine peptidase [Longimicrobiales bacterium]|nr:prolyl oligopeptidase family serine peptidase [Longimicrobiales bacterium]